MLDIFTLGEDVLRQKADKVTVFDSALKLLIEAMFDTMIEADGVGLAAPQIGVSQRFFVVDTRRPGEQLVFINPVILETSQELVSHEEGCLSIPGLFCDVMRPESITVQAQDVAGKAFTLKASGLLARVIQHEYDHLEGTLFIDRVDEGTREKLVHSYEKGTKTKRKRGR